MAVSKSILIGKRPEGRMDIKQIFVFLENKAGRLGEVTKALAQAQINIRALSIADTADFGILRLIVDKENEAIKALNEAGFTTRVTDVVAVEVDDKPGGLAKVMELFQKKEINIEYLYASLEGKAGKAVIIFKLEDHQKGLQIIRENGIPLVASF
jgi:hypothetical protein